ncbi:MAG: superoxide dismutase [Alphaproteobacteria bacterium]|nr:superoxide dismutase [Alphaproteobacteria bacterium]
MAVPFTLKPLPWAEDALSPTISARTIQFHYHKHHQTYVDTLNKLVSGTRYAGMPLEQVVVATAGGKDANVKQIFNNAAQVWNHDFFWRSLTPKGSAPSGPLKEAIERDFGGTEDLTRQLAEAGKSQFGSGWAWLCSKGGKLSVEKTPNAENPMSQGTNCLLTVDVWEHAYYLDYQNERPRYLEEVLVKLLNWDFAAENLQHESEPVRAAA